jgi:hypothetical protein
MDPTTETTTFTTLDDPANDTWTVRVVAILLGVIALAVVVGGVVAALLERTLPGEIVTIGATAAGALGALLASTASRRT